MNGDETVIDYWRGNKELVRDVFRNQDATVLADNIEKSLISRKIAKDNKYIFADDGGVGRAVIDILRRKGWIINRVLNQSAPKNKKQFRNRGAELWSKFNRLVETGIIIPLDDDKFYSQLSSRKYKESVAGIDKLCLQAKKEMIAEGLPSPDRADAAILAFTDCKLVEWLDVYEKLGKGEAKNDSRTMSAEEIEESIMWSGFKVQKRKVNANMSLSVMTGHTKRKKGRYG